MAEVPEIVLLDENGIETVYSDAYTLEVDTPDGDTTTYVNENLLRSQQQTDWEQTDETQVDFIKNKPTIPEAYTHPDTHPASMITGLAAVATSGAYENLRNKPFGDIVLLPETEAAFHEVLSNCYSSSVDLMDTAVIGETYLVIWDGIEYTCVAKDSADVFDTADAGTFCLGNATKFLGLGWGEDTGEPFLVIVSGEDDTQLLALTDDTASSHRISIRPVNNIRKIDAKYLPDDYGGNDGITAADVTAMLASAGVIVPVAAEDNLLLADSEGDIYVL